MNKYFNKKKTNEIHVINNTTLEFPDKGLVCILGPSGSGKTTLLNIIGGLDKIDSGEIIFKNYKIKKYNARKWDLIRSKHFGYIFQNYLLLPDLTVYENLELVLKMFNLDKEEVEKRIEYALSAVGLEKYKKRKASKLSGGQQQRIAIARALVKSPDVVIADEPTGNLDEKNTIQIMNIIKKISKECLVILVTHEERIANFYADRIIRVLDGKVVSDKFVNHNDTLASYDELNIYLPEFAKKVIDTEEVRVNYYYPSINEKNKINLNIIYKNNTFYIQSLDEEVKISFVDKNSEIKVIETKRPQLDLNQVYEIDYYLPKIINKGKKFKQVINLKDNFKLALSRFGKLRKLQKLFFFVMFFASIMITIGFTTFIASKKIDEEKFLFFNRNIVIVDKGYNEDVLDVLNEEEFPLMDPNLSIVTYYKNLYFNRNDTINATNIGTIIPVDVVSNLKIYNNYGRLIENPYEVLIDKYLVDLLLESDNFKSAGIKYYDQFLGLKFSLNQENNFESDTFTIVGIVDNDNPNLYVDKETYKNSIITIYSRNTLYLDVNFKSINSIQASYYYEIVNSEVGNIKMPISEFTFSSSKAFISPSAYISIKNLYNDFTLYFKKGKYSYNYGILVDMQLKIVGVIDISKSEEKVIFVTEEFTNDFYTEILKNQDYMYIYSSNPDNLITRLIEKGYKAMTYYDFEMKRQLVDGSNIGLYIFSLVILGFSLVFLFFLIRSSLMSRIYEIGVYRALGISKLNVYKIFFIEIFTITLFTSLIGIMLVNITIIRINAMQKLIYYPFYIPLLSFIFIIFVNSVIGLLPVTILLRHTPANILSKYDL